MQPACYCADYPVTNYSLEVIQVGEGSSGMIFISTENSIKADDLLKDTIYVYRISAINSVGTVSTNLSQEICKFDYDTWARCSLRYTVYFCMPEINNSLVCNSLCLIPSLVCNGLQVSLPVVHYIPPAHWTKIEISYMFCFHKHDITSHFLHMHACALWIAYTP